jgi:hypothetical protein
MPTQSDPRSDADLAKAAPFAQPILLVGCTLAAGARSASAAALNNHQAATATLGKFPPGYRREDTEWIPTLAWLARARRGIGNTPTAQPRRSPSGRKKARSKPGWLVRIRRGECSSRSVYFFSV